jgi:hypothetical protein
MAFPRKLPGRGSQAYDAKIHLLQQKVEAGAAPSFKLRQRSKFTCCHSRASYMRDHHLYNGVVYLKQVNLRGVKSCRFCGSTCFTFFQHHHIFPLQNSRVQIELTASGFTLTEPPAVNCVPLALVVRQREELLVLLPVCLPDFDLNQVNPVMRHPRLLEEMFFVVAICVGQGFIVAATQRHLRFCHA